jgi:putative transposase
MRSSRFTEEQIIGILKEGEAGANIGELCRRHEISKESYSRWKAKYGGLDVSEARRRRRQSRATIPRLPFAAPSRPNQGWSMDFIHDALTAGRKFKVLTIEDQFAREALATETDHSLPGKRVVEVLERLRKPGRLPEWIVCDNEGPFAGNDLDRRAFVHGVRLAFIEPGKPQPNGYQESFHARLRDECLNQHWFTGLDDAQQKIEAWRVDYNTQRSHSSLAYRTPAEFAAAYAAALRSLPPATEAHRRHPEVPTGGNPPGVT